MIGLNTWNTKFSEFFYGSFYLHVPLWDLATCYCQKVGSIFHLHCNVQMLPLTAFQRLFISGTVEYTHMQNKNSINKTFFIVVWSLSHVQFFNFSVLHGAQPARLLCPMDFPGKNTGVACHFPLRVIFPTQGSNLHLCVSCTAGRFFTSVLPGKQWSRVVFPK